MKKQKYGALTYTRRRPHSDRSPAVSHIPIALPHVRQSPTLSLFRTRFRTKEVQKRSHSGFGKCWACAENYSRLRERSVGFYFGGATVYTYCAGISAGKAGYKPHFTFINK
jgi:hypothetical protein